MGTYTGFGIGFLNFFFNFIFFIYMFKFFFWYTGIYICIFNSNSLIRHD